MESIIESLFLLDPLKHNSHLLYEKLNHLFHVPYFPEKRFEEAMEKSFLHYYNGNLYRGYISQLIYDDTSTSVCHSAEEFTNRILESFLERLL